MKLFNRLLNFIDDILVLGKDQQEHDRRLKKSTGCVRSEQRGTKTLVFADASPVGLGAVLVQIGRRGPRVIAYGNKTLSECEKRYCQTEKEALALVWAVEHFHMFLYGKEFDLVTDHKPLEVIFGPRSKPGACIERWILRYEHKWDETEKRTKYLKMSFVLMEIFYFAALK